MRNWLIGLAPRRRTFMVGLCVVALLAAGGIVTTNRTSNDGPAPAAFTHAFRDRRFHPPGPPIILVPGYGGGQSGLDGLAEAIRETGRFPIVFRLPGDGMGDLNLQAEALQAFASRIVRFAGPVDVVGYSAGGVVVRLWVAEYGGATEARHIVTLGSPLHGARLAAVGQALAPGACPVACQQLVPGSVLLTALAAKPIPKGIDWMSIWTTDDKTVDPPDSARLDGAMNVPVQSICPREVVSHAGLPTDPVVTGLVRSALWPGSIPAPTSVYCRRPQHSGWTLVLPPQAPTR